MILSRIWSAGLVQMNGCLRWFQPLIWVWLAHVDPAVELEMWLVKRATDRSVVDVVARSIASYAELHRSIQETSL